MNIHSLFRVTKGEFGPTINGCGFYNMRADKKWQARLVR